MRAKPFTFSIDIGGTKIKTTVLNSRGEIVSERLCVKTPTPSTPNGVIQEIIRSAQSLPAFDRISVGFPGVVRQGKIITAPNLGTQSWKGFDLANVLKRKFRKPVRVLNDADMQGLAVIKGKGLELVVTLGTGVGTAYFRNGELMPHLELAHHPIAKNGKTYNEYLGEKIRKRIGNKAWNKRLKRALDILYILMQYDTVYLGGGNSRLVTLRNNKKIKIVSNVAGLLGGVTLWRGVGEMTGTFKKTIADR